MQAKQTAEISLLCLYVRWRLLAFPAPSECLVSRSALRFHSQRAVIVHAACCDCLCSVVKSFWQQADFVLADFYFYVLSLMKSPFAGC